MVEGDSADIVVKNVGLNDAVKESATNETEFAVNCRSCTTDIVPACARIMGKSWIGMLKVSDSNWWTLDVWSRMDIHTVLTEPMINPQVGGKIPNGHVGKTEFLAK